MRELVVDASGWTSDADCYRDVLTALEAPHWHGRNWDAMRDSLVTGDINGVEPPFLIKLVGDRRLPAAPRAWVRQLVDVVLEARADDRDIEVEIAPTLGFFS